MSRLCATVLVLEAVLIWLAIPVALSVEHASPRNAGVAGVILAVAAIVLAALARRRLRWTLAGGSVLQALVIAAGAVVPVMYFLGAIFAALWIIGIMLARHVAAASSQASLASPNGRPQHEGPGEHGPGEQCPAEQAQRSRAQRARP